MTLQLSENTKAILLLTAPLIVGKAPASRAILTPGEYKRLARHLLEIKRQPADLVSSEASEILQACQPLFDADRLQRLLDRGFLLSQAVERWHARAIWVVSRADPQYPKRLKSRLREDAPAVLYGCGNISLLESGGLAVVGSRHVNDSLIDYTMEIGDLAARSGRAIVSGGARGIDQAAMRGALEAGGHAVGILADSLERASMNRDNRNLLIDGQLVLASPYDPSAGFNVGNAMQRNKFIYALADAALVVNSDLNKGGTWAGAVEQLDKFRFVPVYVRSSGEPSSGLQALRVKGALDWPNPQDEESLAAVFDASAPQDRPAEHPDLPLFSEDAVKSKPAPSVQAAQVHQPKVETLNSSDAEATEKHSEPAASDLSEKTESGKTDTMPAQPRTPAETLFDAVRDVIQQLLVTPMKESEIAAALNVSPAQARAWLQNLVTEGALEKTRKPAGYVTKQCSLL